MKLHSDFHDYYDTAIGYGIDSKVYYSRFTTEVEKNFKFKTDFPRLAFTIKPFLLGFCGEIYPLAELVKYGERLEILETFFAYDSEELERKRKEWEPDEPKFFYEDKRTRGAARKFFEDWRMRDDAVFLENKVPVWIYKLYLNNKTIVLNPRLKSYEFNRIRDAHAAFQEISVYLANILVEQKETAPVDDIHRIEQHGFDSKTSFRKEKR